MSKYMSKYIEIFIEKVMFPLSDEMVLRYVIVCNQNVLLLGTKQRCE